jgi:hypothetical protein
MLGFVLGALFVIALPRRHPESPPPPAAEPARPPPAARQPPRLTTAEAVFTEWARYAVWENDRTEVAIWNAETGDYTDCFEVLRSGDGYYFRSISRLTRPVLTHGVRPDSPLRFTETEEQRQEWLGQKAQEDWRALGEAMHPKSEPSR